MARLRDCAIARLRDCAIVDRGEVESAAELMARVEELQAQLEAAQKEIRTLRGQETGGDPRAAHTLALQHVHAHAHMHVSQLCVLTPHPHHPQVSALAAAQLEARKLRDENEALQQARPTPN
eukprot:788848-Prymnesium_polylepis.1